MQYVLTLGHRDDITAPSLEDIRAACADVRDGLSGFFVVGRGGRANEFIQSAGALDDHPDGPWAVEHADASGHYVAEVPAAAVPELVTQWMGLMGAWEPGPEWRLMEPENEWGLTTKEMLQIPELRLTDGMSADDLLAAPYVYVQADDLTFVDPDDVADIDLLVAPNRPLRLRSYGRSLELSGYARVGETQLVRTRTLFRSELLDALEALIADRAFVLGDKFHVEFEDSAEHMWFSIALAHVYERRVSRPLKKRVRELAKAVVDDPAFDHLDRDRIAAHIAALSPADQPRVVRLVDSRVRKLIEKRGLAEQTRAGAVAAATRYLATLTEAERDRLAMLTHSERHAIVDAAHPKLDPRRRSEVAGRVFRALATSTPERQLRYATVARALLATGMQKSDVAALLDIPQAKMSMAMNDAPQDVRLPDDDHLRRVIDGIALLDDRLPTAAEVIQARQRDSRRDRQQRRAARDDLPLLVARLRANLDEWDLDRFPFMTSADEDSLIARSLPELPSALVATVAAHLRSELRQVSSWEDRAKRYGAAINTLRARGATLKQAREHLGISEHAARSGRTLAGQEATVADLPPDDVLHGVVARWRPQ